MKEALALFAKAAVPGRVKTRLTPALNPEQAAAFHDACVRQAWAKIRGVAGDGAFLFSDQEWEPWDELAGAQVRFQCGGDLGRRMHGCFVELAEEGFERIVIVGADSPTLPPTILREALDRLAEKQDAVLGPTEDGGYYAVGCLQPHPEMFAGVKWSSETTLVETRAAFDRVGYRTALLPEWWDVDTPDDLNRISVEPPGSRLGKLLADFARNPPAE